MNTDVKTYRIDWQDGDYNSFVGDVVAKTDYDKLERITRNVLRCPSCGEQREIVSAKQINLEKHLKTVQDEIYAVISYMRSREMSESLIAAENSLVAIIHRMKGY